MLLGGGTVGLRHLIFGIHLVEFLGRNHAFLIEAFHPFIRFAVDFYCGLGLLPHLIGHLYLLFACPVLCLLTLGRGGAAHGGGLHHLGINLGTVYVGEGVTGLHHVAFLDIYLVDTAWHLVADTVFGSVYFAHECFFLRMDGHKACQCHNDYQPNDNCKAGQKGFICFFHNVGRVLVLLLVNSHSLT